MMNHQAIVNHFSVPDRWKSVTESEMNMSCLNPRPVHWFRADSRFAPSQWETALLCNEVSHWLGASPESALWLIYFCRLAFLFPVSRRGPLLQWASRRPASLLVKTWQQLKLDSAENKTAWLTTMATTMHEMNVKYIFKNEFVFVKNKIL